MKNTLLKAVGIVVLLAWLSLGLGLALDVSRETWFIWVTAVALISEAAIWIVAATLGVAVVQARQRIWQWFTRPFRGDAEA
jgi:hypothetical protein